MLLILTLLSLLLLLLLLPLPKPNRASCPVVMWTHALELQLLLVQRPLTAAAWTHQSASAVVHVLQFGQAVDGGRAWAGGRGQLGDVG
jgi:hypothetical protein